MAPDGVLKVDTAAGSSDESYRAGMTETVPLLGGRGMARAELVC
jgi:hypothetical protein